MSVAGLPEQYRQKPLSHVLSEYYAKILKRQFKVREAYFLRYVFYFGLFMSAHVVLKSLWAQPRASKGFLSKVDIRYLSKFYTRYTYLIWWRNLQSLQCNLGSCNIFWTYRQVYTGAFIIPHLFTFSLYSVRAACCGLSNLIVTIDVDGKSVYASELLEFTRRGESRE